MKFSDTCAVYIACTVLCYLVPRCQAPHCGTLGKCDTQGKQSLNVHLQTSRGEGKLQYNKKCTVNTGTA
jgi:hypothetical protein